MFYDSIISYFNNSTDKIFTPKSFYVINSNLRNFRSYKITSPIVDISSYESIGVKAEEKVQQLILDEFNRNINKVVINEIFNTNKFEWIDFRDSSIDYILEAGRKIVESIIYHSNKGTDYRNLITNNKIAACLQDSSYFHISAYNSGQVNQTSGDVYEIGSIYGIKVWVDPYMKFTDDRIVMFNSVHINIDDIRSSIISEDTFHPRIEMIHKLDFRVSDSKVIYVVENESCDGWLKVKQLNRDTKINQILDEED